MKIGKLEITIERRWRQGGFEWMVEVKDPARANDERHRSRMFPDEKKARKWAKKVEAGKFDPWQGVRG